MNANQKKVLQHHHPDLVRDLELRPDLIASFIHLGLFNEDMIDEIQAESTRKKQIQKLLSILPRRGPRAFDKFVRAIQDSYDWLAKPLRDTLHELNLKNDTGQISDKEKVAIYVHEHFGTSKRFCEDDKKDIGRFLLKKIRENSNRDEVDGRLQRQDSIETDSDIEEVAVRKEVENDQLKRVYELLMKTLNKDGDSAPPYDIPKEFNIDMIEDKVNELNGKVTQLQEQIEECYNAIGVENKDVPLQELVQKLAKDQQRAVKLQQDLDNLEKHRKAVDIKLEVTQAELSRKVKEMASFEHENEKLHLQKKELKEKCDQLEKIHLKHVEKQQTLIALKSLVSELNPPASKSMRESVNHAFDMTDGHCEELYDKYDKPKMRLSLPKIRGAHRHDGKHLHHEHPKPIRKIQHPSITKAKEVYEHPWK